MSVTGNPDDEPGGGPQKVGYSIADITAGLYASIAILAALTIATPCPARVSTSISRSSTPRSPPCRTSR